MRKTKLARCSKRILTIALSIAMIGTMVPMPITNPNVVKADTTTNSTKIVEDFESSERVGTTWGCTATLSNEAHTGTQALLVNQRQADWHSYVYDVSSLAGKSVHISSYMRVDSEANLMAVLCLKSVVDGKDQYDWIASAPIKNGEYVNLENYYNFPTGAESAYFMVWDPAENTGVLNDFLLDDVSMRETKFLSEDFEGKEEAPLTLDDIKGNKMGNPTLAITDGGYDSSHALAVTGRTENYFGYAYDLSAYAGNTISLSAKVSAYETIADDETSISATLKTTKSGEDDSYNQVASITANGSEYTTLTGTYEVPANCDSYTLYFEAPKEVSYKLDNVLIGIVGDYSSNSSEKGYVDTSSYAKLKDLYQEYFKVGGACEAMSHWGGSNPLSEIGNPNKEQLLLSQFNSMTFGNELKPAYNMGYTDPTATETNLPFVIDTSAKEMLDFAKANNIQVRGHVLVWHSQCEDAVFCKDYEPKYTDTDKKILDPSCLVTSEVMLQRMESYIDHVMKYMYENGYADVIYAWDVVNEAIEVGTNQYNLRNSYWYQTIGPDFIYYAFKYTREAVNKYSTQYAGAYGVDSSNATQLETIQPKLFYNDYNEFQADKRDAIIHTLTDDINGHNIKGEGLIDGVGMQAHLSDNTNIDTFIEALRMYNAAVGEVHITELDVTQTSSGVNADYYQAVFYHNLFKALVNEVKNGVNLTSVTIWGLTDDNSWKKEASPLLFNADLSKKLAFDGIVYAITGEELPEPAYVAPDFSDINTTFDELDTDTTAASLGFTARGDGELSIQHEVTFTGDGALLDTGRTATWNGASFDVSRFVGQTIAISAWVKSKADQVKLSADIDGTWPNIAAVDTSNGNWTQIYGTYKVPSEMTALKLYFEASTTDDIYIDNVEVKLIGLEEGFEEETNIASPRGVGHMPVVTVVSTESHNEGGKSLHIMREAQDATMKFNVTKYIGQTVSVSAYVKTTDKKVKLGFDADTPIQITEVDAVSNEWTKVTGTYTISNTLTSANMYIETDGNADYYVDDIVVQIAEQVDDVEGETLNFTTRWSGAGKVAKVEDGTNNHAAVLTDRTANYEGIVFDVSPFLGMEVEIVLDVKTSDKTISLTGDISDKWPNYLKTTSTPNEYKTIRTLVKLPNDLQALKLYVETEGTADIYVDNLRITRVPLGTEYKVIYNSNGHGSILNSIVAKENSLLTKPNELTEDGYTFLGWYKEADCKNAWDFNVDRVVKDTTLYAGWKSAGTTNPSNPSTPSNNENSNVTNNTNTNNTYLPSITESTSVFQVTYTSSTDKQDYIAKGTDIKTHIDKKQTLVYSRYNAMSRLESEWTFKPEYVIRALEKLVSINLNVEVSSTTVNRIEGCKIAFAQEGTLPMAADVKVDVSNQFKPGNKIYLYRYNGDKKKLSCVPNNKYFVDKDGFVTLSITSGDEYVLLDKVAAKSDKVSVLSQVEVNNKSTLKRGQQVLIQINYPDSIQIVENLKDFDGTGIKGLYGAQVTYSSSNKKVATVDKDGNVTGKKNGKVIITTTIKLSNNTKKSYMTMVTIK